MITWQQIKDKLWSGRQTSPYAAQPSEKQVENAQSILEFTSTDSWQKYSDYLCVLLGEAMESSFVSLKKGDTNGVMIWVARAEAIYQLLTEKHNAEAIIAKANQIIITPPTPTRRDS